MRGPLRKLPLVFFGLLVLASCRGTEDYLSDLYTLQRDGDGRLPLEVFDAGQLAYEAYSGLVDQEALTLSQMGRAIAYAGRTVNSNEVPLLRSAALAMMAHFTLHYPLPPVSSKLDERAGRRETIRTQTPVMARAMSRLAVGRNLIPALDSPDRATVERALKDLKELTGQEFGREADAWRNWWAENEPKFRAQVAAEVAEPMKALTSIRYPTLRLAELILSMFASGPAMVDIPELREQTQTGILILARQVVELAVVKALSTDESPLVRAEAALAAAQIRAPAFVDPLVQTIAGEQDRDARIRMIRALAWYPSKQGIMALLLCLRDERPAVVSNACDVLAIHAGRMVGPSFGPWMEWWKREGEDRWP